MTLYLPSSAGPRLRRGRPFKPDAEIRSDDGAGDEHFGDAGIRLYERALGRDPHNHLLLIDLAREYGLHQRLLDADRTLLHVLELYPQSVKVRSMVAASYAMVGLPQQAIEHYRLALELDPQHPESAAILAALSSLNE